MRCVWAVGAKKECVPVGGEAVPRRFKVGRKSCYESRNNGIEWSGEGVLIRKGGRE